MNYGISCEPVSSSEVESSSGWVTARSDCAWTIWVSRTTIRYDYIGHELDMYLGHVN